jgi:hypothetical protein
MLPLLTLRNGESVAARKRHVDSDDSLTTLRRGAGRSREGWRAGK